jgi:hypothetical protein
VVAVLSSTNTVNTSNFFQNLAAPRFWKWRRTFRLSDQHFVGILLFPLRATCFSQLSLQHIGLHCGLRAQCTCLILPIDNGDVANKCQQEELRSVIATDWGRRNRQLFYTSVCSHIPKNVRTFWPKIRLQRSVTPVFPWPVCTRFFPPISPNFNRNRRTADITRSLTLKRAWQDNWMLPPKTISQNVFITFLPHGPVAASCERRNLRVT